MFAVPIAPPPHLPLTCRDTAARSSRAATASPLTVALSPARGGLDQRARTAGGSGDTSASADGGSAMATGAAPPPGVEGRRAVVAGIVCSWVGGGRGFLSPRK